MPPQNPPPIPPPPVVPAPPAGPPPPPKPIQPAPDQSKISQLLAWIKAHKYWVMAGAAIVILVPAAIFGYLKLHHRRPKPAPVAAKPAKPAPPKPLHSPLTGLTVTAAVLAQPVFATVIENSPDARPQSGLSEAGVVYETLAEGGITRFLAVFLDNQPGNLGPVRSLRPYFIDWAQEYNNAPIAHAGGSAEALGQVPILNVKSMNGLNYGSAFRRAGDRYAPHNLYTSTASLIALMDRLHYTTPASFASWKYKTDQPPATPSHPTITVNFSYPLFTAKYQFDTGCDCYNRFIAGAPHIERNSGKQIQVKNVVTIVVQTAYDAKGHALDTTVGSGKAYVFVDGGVTAGTWKKDSRLTRMQFLDAAGQPISLNPGNTWVEAIAQTGSVNY